MSVLDKIIAAVTPPESDEARAQARSKANAVAVSGDWLSLVLEHHLMIESAFVAVKGALSAAERVDAQRELAGILVAHSIAEELVLYPALALNDEKAHAEMGYGEQAAVKIQMAALDKLDPMSQDYLDKLEHIRGAVAHHVYQEEGTWFPELQAKAASFDHSQWAARYMEEFERYIDGGSATGLGEAEIVDIDVLAG
jgi:Hemerythrin HHE cation binding domain